MKHKGLFKNVLGLGLVLALGLFMSGCGEDTPPAPTVKLYVTIDGFTVDIAAEATNADTWAWDYGDGTTSDSIGSNTHTYAEGGDYTITCTVTGEGGSATATEQVQIATIEEILMSHPWVLANAGSTNGIGYEITSKLTISLPTPDVLAVINSLRSADETYDFTDEYNDTYTFKSGDNGNYDINTGNGNALTPWVYAKLSADELIKGSCEAAGFFIIGIGDTKDANWKIHKNETLKINTVTDADKDGSPDDINNDGVIDENDITQVVFEDTNFIEFVNGGYLGIKDYGVTDGGNNAYESIAIVRSATSDAIEVTLFIHMAVDGASGIGINEPCYFANLTFVPAPVN